MLCVFLLSHVWSVSRLYDFDLNVLLQAATWIFAPLFVSRWLASQLCPMDDTARSALSLSNRSRVQARFLIRWLGVVISAMILTDYLRDMGDFSSGTAAVIVFVLVSIAGVGAFRFGGLLLRQSHRAPDATEVEQVPHRFVVRLGQGLAITAAISIALSVIGYSDLAVALLRAVLLVGRAFGHPRRNI